MELAKKKRSVLRTGFTKALSNFNACLEDAECTDTALSVSFCTLESKAAALDEVQEAVIEAIMEIASEVELQDEYDESDAYKLRFTTAKIQYAERKNRVNTVPIDQRVTSASTSSGSAQTTDVKLPALEFQKFNGEVCNWLSFWNCFKKIDENKKLSDTDKFQLLVQAMETDSTAHTLVKSYPQSAENYKKALNALRARFGQEEVLIELYAHELIHLVFNYMINPKNRMSLADLYDKLVAHLRSLESLGVTTGKDSSLLVPLVESSLPEELLRIWQRKKREPLQDETDASHPRKDRLTRLLEFIENEVNGEMRISIVKGRFDVSRDSESQKQKNHNSKKPANPTAMGLLSANGKEVTCLFCDSKSHRSENCAKAKNMTLIERQELVKKKHACFNCLKYGHGFRSCRVRLNCSICNRRHVDLMCNAKAGDEKSENSENKVTASVRKELSCIANVRNCPPVFMQTFKAKVYSDSDEVIARVLIDSGSQRSYVTKEIAKKLKYEPIGEQRLVHMLFGGSQTETVTHKKYRVRMQSLLSDFACNFAALDQKEICGQIEPITNSGWVEELQDFGIELTDTWDQDEPISILIGADVAGKLLTGHKQEFESGLVAFETLFGWTIMGEMHKQDTCENATVSAIAMYVSNCDVKDLWSLDVLGINDPITHKTLKEHEETMCTQFLDTVSLNKEGRYEVQLPWSENHMPLGDNKGVAIKRLQSVIIKLKKEGRYEAYDGVFGDWEHDGVIERVPKEEEDDWGHYLPHRHVVKENSTTVIRPVFDASAKQPPHPSLNECLHTGPNLIEQVPSTLLRFREGEIGVTSDIKQAFLQISIHPKHRNVLRFYWYDKDSNLILFRHCRVVFGMCCSPFMLGAVITLHLKNLLQSISDNCESNFTINNIEKLLSSFYVDNCVTSVNSIEELNVFMSEAKKAMELAGFDLRGWEFSGDSLTTNKTPVLGILWDKSRDVLSLNVSNLSEVNFEKITKRDILSYTHRIFDPLGFVCPITLIPRILLQETWAKSLTWDEDVGAEIKTRFLKWFKELKGLGDIEIPRCMIGKIYPDDEITIHTFCDASKFAYASVIFIRIKSDSGVKVSIVQAKSRVAPMKKDEDSRKSIPRLELLAATIGARLASTVINTLNLKNVKTYFWSDSSTVVAWINRDYNWSTFVHNRVKEIRKLSDPKSWKHIPGNMNPADLPSRGCTVARLLSLKWHEGPEWLLGSPESWPIHGVNVLYNEDEINTELKRNAQFIEKTITFINLASTDRKLLLKKFQKECSKYSKIVRVIAYMKRFVKFCTITPDLRNKDELSFEEVNNAEKSLLKLIQTESLQFFDKKIDEQYALFNDDDGLIRLKTKIILREDTFNFKCPYVLSGKNEIVKLLIREKHETLHHAGVQIVMNVLREKFWIIRPRQAIRSVIKECATCRRHESKPGNSVPAPLPLNRVRDAAVFEVVGVDYAGPIYLKEGQKAWILIFTCAVFRAVHFELVCSLNVGSLIMALERFIHRRGRPSVVYSDNGLSFSGLNKELKRVDFKKLAGSVAMKEIDWKFNPPTAAWWGGFWERLIGILKKLLRRTLKRSSLNYEEMSTVLIECEGIINSRPITFVSENESEMKPLAPSDFLQDIKEIGDLDLDQVEKQGEKRNLSKRHMYRQNIKQELRRRFRLEYLGTLIKQCGSEINHVEIKVGDIVLIGRDKVKRLEWPLARVIDVIAGKDGNIRVVRLKTATGELIRPVQRVFPLEVNHSDVDSNLRDIVVREGKVTKKVCEKQRPQKTVKVVENKEPHVTRYGRKIKNVDRLAYK